MTIQRLKTTATARTYSTVLSYEASGFGDFPSVHYRTVFTTTDGQSLIYYGYVAGCREAATEVTITYQVDDGPGTADGMVVLLSARVVSRAEYTVLSEGGTVRFKTTPGAASAAIRRNAAKLLGTSCYDLRHVSDRTYRAERWAA